MGCYFPPLMYRYGGRRTTQRPATSVIFTLSETHLLKAFLLSHIRSMGKYCDRQENRCLYREAQKNVYTFE